MMRKKPNALIEAEIQRRVDQALKQLRIELVERITAEVEDWLTTNAKPAANADLEPIIAALGVQQLRGDWTCAHCSATFKTRRAASIHARRCKKEAEGKKRCIKPGCVKKSKGARYHHLCSDHANAPKQHWQAWQRKDREA